MDWRILGALLRKEVGLMKRNPFIPKVIFIMPIMVMLVLPLLATLDVREVNVAVVNNDHSQLSRRIISDMDASKEIIVYAVCETSAEGMELIDRGEVDAIVTIPYNYSVKLSDVYIEASGVNATKGMLGTQYVAASIAGTLRQWMNETGERVGLHELSIINMYNPTLNFRNYMIPALMTVLLIIICGFLPTLNLVNEKETGTIEAMNVTPVGKFTFVLSKLIPFWVVGFFVITIGMIIGWTVYGLRPEGDIWMIYLAAILFSLFMSGLGLLIANQSATMLQSIFVMFAFIMIFQLMGGLFTPINSMPDWAQTLTYLIPPRYFNEIMRETYLKGATMADLWVKYSCLGGFAIVTCIFASISYKKRS